MAAMTQENALRFAQLVATRGWRPLFVLMLALLHLAAMRGAEDLWARGLMLAHFGLFILWQPFMRGEQRLTAGQTLGVIAISLGILFFLNWWLLTLWISVFAGIVGGKVFLFQARWLRRFYLVVLLYLVSLLLVWVVPNCFIDVSQPREVELFAQYGLPFLFVAMLLVPAETDAAETPQIVDFFYAAMIFLLLLVLVLGSFAFMTVVELPYVEALSYSVLIIAAVLILLSLAWNPRAGFSGLSMYFSRYLLSIGLPFEQWLYFLAELSQIETSPERFVRQACAGLVKLTWVAGGFWRTSDESGEFGEVSGNSVEYTNQELHLRVFTRLPLSPSLTWHFHLLGQLLCEFYIAKQRERKLQQQTYVQAVHETGARMTHDVKNLLQSLNTLCAAVEGQASVDVVGLAALMRRQLPVITQRLQQTLDKMQKPGADSGHFVQAKVWWESLQRSYANREIDFDFDCADDTLMLPKELFDSAADNMLQNALRKRTLGESVAVRVALRHAGGTMEFSVCDSGAPVPAEVATGLFRRPLSSESGFGIGLYQTSRLAEISGFSLQLQSNETGKVCFCLYGGKRRNASS